MANIQEIRKLLTVTKDRKLLTVSEDRKLLTVTKDRKLLTVSDKFVTMKCLVNKLILNLLMQTLPIWILHN